MRTRVRAHAQVSFTLSDMFLRGTNLGQLLNTHPLLLKLGRSSAPSMRRSFYDKASLSEYDGSYLAAARAAGARFFKCGDWRCAPKRAARFLAAAASLLALLLGPLALASDAGSSWALTFACALLQLMHGPGTAGKGMHPHNRRSGVFKQT